MSARILFGLLLVVAAATELDLAWTHDAWRLAGCGVALMAIWTVRHDLTHTERRRT